jgi:hypothetical protein
MRLLEVRGTLPDSVTCPETAITFPTGKQGGIIPKKSNFSCASCGTVQDVMNSIKASRKAGAWGGYAVQGYSHRRDADGTIYGGRFFSPFDQKKAEQYSAAVLEWEQRKNDDVARYW